VPPLPIIQLSISSQKNHYPPAPTVYRYYYQEILYIIGKQLLILLIYTFRPGTEIAH
jgi:hypothetical protein